VLPIFLGRVLLCVVAGWVLPISLLLPTADESAREEQKLDSKFVRSLLVIHMAIQWTLKKSRNANWEIVTERTSVLCSIDYWI